MNLATNAADGKNLLIDEVYEAEEKIKKNGE